MKKVRLWILAAILLLCGTVSFASCTANDDNSAEKQPTIERIQERGKLLVGTTGDYRPLSYREATPATMYSVDAPVYNMMGQQVNKSHKGLVIYKGRIYMNK